MLLECVKEEDCKILQTEKMNAGFRQYEDI